jgi:exodeoxyribonuclease-3
VTLRLLSYNVKYGGVGRDAALAAVIRAAEPDVVVLQEATDARVVAALAEATGLPHHGARPAHSLGYLSRLPVAHHAWHRPARARHAFLELVLGGTGWRVFGLHLRAWFSKWTERRRAEEIRLLLDGIREHQHGPHVIVGDFNALAPGERLQVARMPRWIRVMIWISGRDIARDTIRTLHDAGYADGFRLHHPEVAGSTFPTWDPHLRLDYAFVPARDAGRVARCAVVTTPAEALTASDHFPLVVELAERD